MTKYPRIEWHSESEEFRDTQQGFQVMHEEVVSGYNRQQERLEELEAVLQKIIDDILPQVRDMDSVIAGEWMTPCNVADDLEVILGLKKERTYD